MSVRSVCFDDNDESDLVVFSGNDLLLSHYDGPDLDWQEMAERSALDERRGLVIAQVAVLEDLIDEFLHYLVDPADRDQYQRKLDAMTIGPRLDQLEAALDRLGLLDERATSLLADVGAVVRRRNQLAHGTLHWLPVRRMSFEEMRRDGVDLEWLMVDRKSRSVERITMAGLRRDVYAAIGVFTSMLGFAEELVERAPQPVNFVDGAYLAAPTP